VAERSDVGVLKEVQENKKPFLRSKRKKGRKKINSNDYLA
jgi:hypothetical protein